MTSNNPSVYLSYQSQGANRSPMSQQVVQLLHEELNKRGINTFWDHDLPAGANFPVEQERQLSGRDILIVVLSPTTYLSVSGVIPEVRRALELKKRIIPVKVDGFRFSDPRMGEPFQEVRNFISIQFEPENAEAFVEKLVKDILANPVSSVPPPISVDGNGTPPQPSNGSNGGKRGGVDLRDPIWQFVGVLIAVVTLIVTVLLSRQSPSPSAAEMTGTAIVQANSTIAQMAFQTATQEAILIQGTQTALSQTLTAPSPRPTLNIVPIATIAAATRTPLPTLTPSETSSPMITDTPVPPTVTHTSIPPSAIATNPPPTPTSAQPMLYPLRTPNTNTNTSGAALTLYHDADTLALYVPHPVSLLGMVFRVDNHDHALNDYSSFAGLPWTSVPAPSCFVLRLAGASAPLVDACQRVPPNNLFIQQVSPADVFWHNSTTGIDPAITVLQGDVTLGFCPGSSSACPITMTGGS